MKILQSLLISVITSSSLFGISIQERAALHALYNSTNGDNWTDNSNWYFDFLGTSNPCTDDWYGITCDLGNHISGITLSNNNLIGTIPPEIGDFSKLRNLRLGHNFLSGNIPSEIKFMGDDIDFGTNIGIFLQNNQLTGSIPPEIGDIYPLITLSLQNNQLTGSIPPEIGDLFQLRFLSLQNNQLSGAIPQEIGNLTALRDFNASYNQLSGDTPQGITYLDLLENLDLSHNQLVIPYSFGSFDTLQTLDLSYNQIDSSSFISGTIHYSPNLRLLNLSNNQISGVIPSEIGDGNLTVLNLRNNQFSGFLPNNLLSLTPDTNGIDFRNNHLFNTNSTIETWLDSYHVGFNGASGGSQTFYNTQTPLTPDTNNLLILYSATDGDNWTQHDNWGIDNPCTNNWYGVICNGAGEVASLNLYNNNLTGTLPSEIGSITSLTSLNLAGNQLTGAIPSSIGSLSQLTLLSLHHNQLSGAIPSTIGNLSHLTLLALSTNQLVGSIPTSIGNLTSLTSLGLAVNQLSGSIPAEFGHLKDLTNLVLFNNLLEDNLPVEITQLQELTNLDMSSNYLGTNGNTSDLGDWLDAFYTGGRQAFLSSQRIVAPTNLSFTNKTTTSVTLNWHDNSDNEKGFRIFQNGNEIHITAIDETSFSVTGLTPGTAYTFEVKATDEI